LSLVAGKRLDGGAAGATQKPRFTPPSAKLQSDRLLASSSPIALALLIMPEHAGRRCNGGVD
jgi:hypothetical protein